MSFFLSIVYEMPIMQFFEAVRWGCIRFSLFFRCISLENFIILHDKPFSSK